MRKISFTGIELRSQRVRRLRGYFYLPGDRLLVPKNKGQKEVKKKEKVNDMLTNSPKHSKKQETQRNYSNNCYLYFFLGVVCVCLLTHHTYYSDRIITNRVIMTVQGITYLTPLPTVNCYQTECNGLTLLALGYYAVFLFCCLFLSGVPAWRFM